MTSPFSGTLEIWQISRTGRLVGSSLHTWASLKDAYGEVTARKLVAGKAIRSGAYTHWAQRAVEAYEKGQYSAQALTPSAIRKAGK